MIRDKRFKKFYEVGSNRYYVLPFEKDLYLATENFLELPKKLFRKRELTQTIKMLELSVPIMLLFDALVDAKVDEKDEEFEDMTTYVKINNVEIRKTIRLAYQTALDMEINQMLDDFKNWCIKFSEESEGKYTEEEIEDTIKANKDRVLNIIEHYKQIHASNFINTRVPFKKSDNDVVKKMITNGLCFLYSHQLTSTMKCYYLYDLDKFGTITMYKIVCVKEHIKAINSFVYDRNLVQELLSFMENEEL